MSKKMDRQGSRTPADLERRHAFAKRFEETQKTAETANQAAETATQAARIASSVAETENSLSLKVQTIESDLNGEGGVHAQLALKVETDADGKLVSKVHIEGGFLTIETDNFTLTEDGTITATNGTFEGVVTAESGKIGVWHLGKTNINESPSVMLTDVDALYTDLVYEQGYSYRVFLTANGVYVDGQDETGGGYFEHKTWRQICGGIKGEQT